VNKRHVVGQFSISSVVLLHKKRSFLFINRNPSFFKTVQKTAPQFPSCEELRIRTVAREICRKAPVN
jgi:hypothetical protein